MVRGGSHGAGGDGQEAEEAATARKLRWVLHLLLTELRHHPHHCRCPPGVVLSLRRRPHCPANPSPSSTRWLPPAPQDPQVRRRSATLSLSFFLKFPCSVKQHKWCFYWWIDLSLYFFTDVLICDFLYTVQMIYVVGCLVHGRFITWVMKLIYIRYLTGPLLYFSAKFRGVQLPGRSAARGS